MKWNHFYSPRRGEIQVFDALGRTFFALDSEEVLERGLDLMSEEEQRIYIWANFQDVIEDNFESRKCPECDGTGHVEDQVDDVLGNFITFENNCYGCEGEGVI